MLVNPNHQVPPAVILCSLVTDQQAFLHESFVSFCALAGHTCRKTRQFIWRIDLFWGWLNFFGIAVIQHRSSAGTQRLSETLADLLREKNDNAHRLIDSD